MVAPRSPETSGAAWTVPLTLDEFVVVVVDVGGGESEVDVGDHRGLRVWGGSCDPHSRRC